MTRFNCISFDIDQTLVDFASMLKRALQEVSDSLYERFYVRVSVSDFQNERNLIANTLNGVAIDMLELRRLSFLRVLEKHGLDQRFAEQMLDEFTAIRFSDVIFIPGAIELLSGIPAEVKVSALTNGNSNPHKLGFGQFFDTVILGEKYPFKKPDPRVFAVMLSEFSLRRCDLVLHVGDSLTNDVLGANRAGLKSVWFNPDSHRTTEDIRPTFEVSKLTEVLMILNHNVTAGGE